MRVAHWWRAVSHARDRGLAPAVRRGPAQRGADVRVRGAVRRALGAPRSGASSLGRAPGRRRFVGAGDVTRNGGCQDWQVRQAEQTLRVSFVNCLQRADWHRRPANTVVVERGRTDPLAALAPLRQRLRTRHYAYRTESSYADWERRFFASLAERQDAPQPRVDSESIRDLLTHLAVQRRVLASTKN